MSLGTQVVNAAAQALHERECQILGWQVDWDLMSERDRRFYRVLAIAALEAAEREKALV